MVDNRTFPGPDDGLSQVIIDLHDARNVGGDYKGNPMEDMEAWLNDRAFDQYQPMAEFGIVTVNMDSKYLTEVNALPYVKSATLDEGSVGLIQTQSVHKPAA